MPNGIHIQGDFTVPIETGTPTRNYPLPSVPTAVDFTVPFMVLESYFVAPQLDTPRDFSGQRAYLTSVSDLKDEGGGIVSYSSTWSTIPDSHTDFELYPVRLPGFTGQSAGALVNITGAYNSSGLTIITAASGTFSSGDVLAVTYETPLAVGNPTIARYTVPRIARSGTTGTHVVVDVISEPLGVSTWVSVAKIGGNRDPYTENLRTFLKHDYFLPGVSPGISFPSDIPISDKPIYVDFYGNSTETLSTISSPTVAQYRAQAVAGSLVVTEQSALNQWRGNIWKRTTRTHVPK